MNAANTEQEKIEAYLNELRRSLRGLHPDEIREIVEELRSHIVEKTSAQSEISAAGLDAVLAALGSPRDLAREYTTDAVLARAEVTRSPASVLASLFRWASVNLAGFFVLLGALLGYSVGVILYLLGLLKLFHPKTAGVWVWHNSGGDLQISGRLGFVGPPAGATEVLGWWIVPLGVLVGGGLLIITTRIALWCARQFRKSVATHQR